MTTDFDGKESGASSGSVGFGYDAEISCSGGPRAHGGGFDSDDDLIDLIRVESLGGGESRRGPLTGTRALMLAVLEDGIRAYLGKRRTLVDEAQLWIDSRRRTSPFCFDVVCETLGLNPDAVRKALHRMKAANTPANKVLPRVRNNVRVPGRVCLRGRTGNRRAA
ncbi:hypothetical protein L6Q96_21960 [Candidatus Binatia bacterium]|nr:hypothetical protein [Candidatus Binatia bacterium]